MSGDVFRSRPDRVASAACARRRQPAHAPATRRQRRRAGMVARHHVRRDARRLLSVQLQRAGRSHQRPARLRHARELVRHPAGGHRHRRRPGRGRRPPLRRRARSAVRPGHRDGAGQRRQRAASRCVSPRLAGIRHRTCSRSAAACRSTSASSRRSSATRPTTRRTTRHFSRAYLFNFLPFYHIGRAHSACRSSDKVTVLYMLTNGIQQTEDFNDFKSQSGLAASSSRRRRSRGRSTTTSARSSLTAAQPDGPDGLFQRARHLRHLHGHAGADARPRRQSHDQRVEHGRRRRCADRAWASYARYQLRRRPARRRALRTTG